MLVTDQCKCPRCGSKMFLYTDLDSWYAECPSCSYRYDLKSNVRPEEQPGKKEPRPTPKSEG